MGSFLGDMIGSVAGGTVNTVGSIFTSIGKSTTKSLNQLGRDFEKVGEQFDTRKQNEVNYRNASDGIRMTANTVGGITGALAGWKLGEAFGREGQTALAALLASRMNDVGNVVAEIGEDFCAANDYAREATAKGVNVSRGKAFLQNLMNFGTHTYDGAKGSTLTSASNDETIVKRSVSLNNGVGIKATLQKMSDTIASKAAEKAGMSSTAENDGPDL